MEEMLENTGKKGGRKVPTRTWRKWQSMKARCYKPSHPAYRYYGGRIKVCDRWRESYENFLADMGEAPEGLWLERINNDGDYEPGNCKWATPKEQAQNRRKTDRKEPDSLAGKARAAGLPYMLVYLRMKLGWDEETALRTPKLQRGGVKIVDRKKWGIRVKKPGGPKGYTRVGGVWVKRDMGTAPPSTNTVEG